MCGLHIVRKEHSHQAIYKFIEEAEAGHRSGPPGCTSSADLEGGGQGVQNPLENHKLYGFL